MQLSPPQLVPGHTYYSPGLNMQCRPTVCTVKLMALRPHGQCVVRSGGINVLLPASTLYANAGACLAAACMPIA